MEPDAKYALVGAVVTMLAGAIVLSLLWLTDAAGEKEVSRYTIYFRNHSLSGLQVDSDVSMKGIKVGVVDDFQISAIDIEKVRVVIKINADTPIKTDTGAVISKNLVTGIASIDLIGSTSISNPLTEVLGGEEYPVIKEEKTTLDELASSIPSALNDAGEILSVGKQAISPENAEKLNNILTNLESFSSFLSEVEKPSKELIDNLALISQDVSEITSKNKSFFTSLNMELPDIFSDFKTTISHVENASGSFNQQSQKVLTSIKAGIDKVILDLDETFKEVSKAASNISVAMENFDDPGNIISGPGDAELGPGEKSQK